MGLTPAVAAAMGGYAESMAFASQAKRCRRMAELFTLGSVFDADLTIASG